MSEETRHVAEFMSGYMSPRCLNGMDGCDDKACICRCHEDDELLAPDCRVFWAGHGCNLQRGHEGPHRCDPGCLGPEDFEAVFGEDAGDLAKTDGE